MKSTPRFSVSKQHSLSETRYIYHALKGYCRCERWGYIGVFWGAESENVTDF